MDINLNKEKERIMEEFKYPWVSRKNSEDADRENQDDLEKSLLSANSLLLAFQQGLIQVEREKKNFIKMKTLRIEKVV
jgi:hypothetical protein